MLATHSVTFAPLGAPEAERLRGLARVARGFDAAALRATRLGLVAAASGGHLDPEAATGLRLDEEDAILALARTPARTPSERAWKARLVRSWREGGGGGTLLDAMVDAALSADGARAARHGARADRGRGRS